MSVPTHNIDTLETVAIAQAHGFEQNERRIAAVREIAAIAREAAEAGEWRRKFGRAAHELNEVEADAARLRAELSRAAVENESLRAALDNHAPSVWAERMAARMTESEVVAELRAALADANRLAALVSGVLCDAATIPVAETTDVRGLHEGLRTLLSERDAANQRAGDYADTLRAARWAINLGVGCARDLGDAERLSALIEAEQVARAALDRHTAPAPTDQGEP